MKKFNYIVFVVIFFVTCGKDNDNKKTGGNTINVNWASAADSSSKSLIYNFWNAQENCLFFNNSSSAPNNWNGNYWPQGHALDVLADAYNRTGDGFYSHYFDLWYTGVRRANGNKFLNDFYDDMEWIALALFRTYNATGNEKWLTACREVWADIQTGWNTQGKGGIAWSKNHLWSKNACSNGPAAILAAFLYQQFHDEKDLDWALKIYGWEKEYLFNPATGAVNDNLDTRSGTITTWIMTYNQGTFLGAALELYKITGEKTYINDAIKAADHTLSVLINTGDDLLKSEGTGDGGLFKGIFIRYFTQLILSDGISDNARKRYIAALKRNGETLWREGTNKQKVLFGPYWKTAPGDDTGLTEQLSGCMLMEALALLKKKDML